jgi:polysaccharide export outer membrane protein
MTKRTTTTTWNTTTRSVVAVAALLAMLMAGCGTTPPRESAGEMVAGGVPLAPERTLSAGDEFEIRFPFAPEFNDRVSVGHDGAVSPKLLGSVIVGGLTVPEATARLKALYARQIKNPEPSLTVRAYAPEVFWVEGEVARPGLIRSSVPLTLERAVAMAGGAKTGAKTGDILVIRRDAAGAVDAYKAALSRRPGGDDPFLKSFDVVYVPQTAIASVNAFLATYVKSLPFSANFQIAPTPSTTVIAPATIAPR